MALEEEDRALLIKLFYQNGSNSLAALREYRRLKGLRKGQLCKNGLRKMIRKFEQTGDLGVAPGRGRRPIAEEVVDEIAIAVPDSAAHDENGATSARVVARELSIPWSTVRKVLRSVLRLYPYKIHMVHALQPHDPQQRADFAFWFLARVGVDGIWPRNILWTYESRFSLDGAVNTQNCRIWGSSHPHVVREQPLHSAYGADLQLSSCSCTVTSARYSELLTQHVIPALQERGCLATTVFMQDGATPHIGRQVKEVLRAHFGDDRIISRGFANVWPARSPDLNPCDFWLWGYLKDRVYQGGAQSLPDLKASIRRHVAAIPPDLLRASVDNAVVRLQHVIDQQGSHIEPIL